MMKVMSFTYTKDNGAVSRRDFYPLVSPSDKYFGVDMTELDYEDQAFLSKEIYDIEQEKQAKIKAVMEKYDIGHAFRTFIPSKMSEIETD